MEMIIYKATFPNGKAYIGQTKSGLGTRKRIHKSVAKLSRKTSAFYNAINKYGFNSITWDTIEICASWKKMQAHEKRLIYTNDTLCPNGYNVVEGGRQPKYTKELRMKMSIASKGKNLGRKLTEEHKKKISVANKGIKKPSMIGNKNHLGHTGKRWKLTEENKKNISEARKAFFRRKRLQVII